MDAADVMFAKNADALESVILGDATESEALVVVAYEVAGNMAGFADVSNALVGMLTRQICRPG